MASLAEGLSTVKDFTVLTLLPAILVFVIVYALLQKTKLLGEEAQWANMLTAIVTSILFIVVIKAVKFTGTFLPLFAIAIVILVFLWLIFKFIGVEGVFTSTDRAKWGLAAAALVIVVILLTIAFKKVYSSAYDKIISAIGSVWSAITEPAVIALVVMFGSFALVAYAILHEKVAGK